MRSEVHNMDCLAFMRGLPDNAFALAVADPPYAGRGEEVYSGRADGLSAAAEEWAAEAGRDPRVRIVLCGYAGEHDALLRLGWTSERWGRAGGYAHDGGASGVAERDERLYLSPACAHQPDLFSALDA